MSIKRFAVIGVFLCAAVLAFTALTRKCGQSPPAPEVREETPTLKWSLETLVMNAGETRDIEWISNKPLQPLVYCEGPAVAVTALQGNRVRLRAIEGGTGALIAKTGALKSVCVITVNNNEAFSFFPPGRDGNDAAIEGIEIGVGEVKSIDVSTEPATDNEPGVITVPYTKRYLNIGQETKISVGLENGDGRNETRFLFIPETGKNNISVEGANNTAVVKALREGAQYVRISHPSARESKIITFDVLPSAPPPPPVIELSECPLLVAKGETKPLTMTVLNGKSTDNQKFSFQITENGYAVEAKQRGNILDITGIAPGAALIRISNGAVGRDYELMVLVDSYGFN